MADSRGRRAIGGFLGDLWQPSSSPFVPPQPPSGQPSSSHGRPMSRRMRRMILRGLIREYREELDITDLLLLSGDDL
jgi:hypothetical protein